MNDYFMPWLMLEHQAGMQKVWRIVAGDVRRFLPRSPKQYQEALRQNMVRCGLVKPDNVSIPVLQEALKQLQKVGRIGDEELAKAVMLVWSDGRRKQINALVDSLKSSGNLLAGSVFTPELTSYGMNGNYAADLGSIDPAWLQIPGPAGTENQEPAEVLKLIYVCASSLLPAGPSGAFTAIRKYAASRGSAIHRLPAAQGAPKEEVATVPMEAAASEETSPQPGAPNTEAVAGETQEFEPIDWSVHDGRPYLVHWGTMIKEAHDDLAAQHADLGRQIAQGSLTTIAESAQRLIKVATDSILKTLAVAPDLEDLNEWLKQEVAARNDWRISRPGITLDWDTKQPFTLPQHFARVIACIDKIEEYDRSREAAYEQWLNGLKKQHELRRSLAVLVPEEYPGGVVAGEHGVAPSDQLSAIRAACSALEAESTQLAQAYDSARYAIAQVLLQQAKQLRDLGMHTDDLLTDQVKLASIREKRIELWPAEQLVAVAAAAKQRIEELAAARANVSAAELAQRLRHDWQVDTFTALLDRLACDRRNEEIFLLVSALTLVEEERLPLPDTSVRALLEGAARLTASPDGGRLLNLLYSTLEASWQPATQTAAMRWAIALLRAQQAGPAKLPKEMLWLTLPEWPDARMAKWRQLWEMFLLDHAFVIRSNAEMQKQFDAMAAARDVAAQFLVQERGLYLKARSNDARIARLLNKVLLPWYDKRLRDLRTLETKVAQGGPLPDEPQLRQVITACERLAVDLTEEATYQRHEEGIVGEGIDDSSPHIRRASLHIVTDCAGTLRSYAEAIANVAGALLAAANDFSLETLCEELGQHFAPEVISGELRVEMLVSASQTAIGERDDGAALLEGAALVEHALLSQAPLVRRLPTTAAELASHRIDWRKLWHMLLNDIAEPPDSLADTAETLLALHAPSQVLLFANEIDVKLVQQAQQLDDQLSRKTATLYADLLEMGGELPSWQADSRNGRWLLLQRDLNAQLESHREQRRLAEARHQERVAVLFGRTQELQSLLFQQRANMPPSSFESAMRGLQQAQMAAMSAPSATTEIFAAVGSYCDQLLYQAEHDSWPIDKTTALALELHDALTQTQTARPVLDSAKVMELLERRDLAELGLNPATFDESRVETRTELLHHWHSLLDSKKMLTDEMSAPERTLVQKLIQKFALMVQLAQVFGQDNRHIVVTQPIHFGIYRLKLPKSPSLERNCVVLAAPGNPPQPQQIGLIETLIDDNQWLDDRFVILLMPGCTAKLRERLERGRRNAGLVIVDDAILTRMVLAEREQRRAIGILRSIMINAQNAANTEVFRVEKAVEPRTGIFVGREDLIRQVVDGTNNVALYGGRRIGKSSILSVAHDRLAQREHVQIVQHSFEGGRSVWHDDAVAKEIARQLGLDGVVDLQSLAVALHEQLDSDPDLRVVLLFDEIDRYIKSTQTRHLLIETLRALSDRHGDRLRIVVAGFMSLYDCLSGRGPYSGADDPWGRMFHDTGPVPNLKPEHAEEIVREGFWEVLGWHFESSMIPQLIVERTGGHPDFVQHFCSKLQERVAARGDQTVRREDVKAVFFDDDPSYSFVAHVRKTLKMNLDPVAHLLILLIADRARESRRLTFEQFAEVARLSRVEIPRQIIEESLRRLQVTSVVNETKANMYEFAVPDYPLILSRLEETRHVAELEDEVEEVLRA